MNVTEVKRTGDEILMEMVVVDKEDVTRKAFDSKIMDILERAEAF